MQVLTIGDGVVNFQGGHLFDVHFIDQIVESTKIRYWIEVKWITILVRILKTGPYFTKLFIQFTHFLRPV